MANPFDTSHTFHHRTTLHTRQGEKRHFTHTWKRKRHFTHGIAPLFSFFDRGIVRKSREQGNHYSTHRESPLCTRISPTLHTVVTHKLLFQNEEFKLSTSVTLCSNSNLTPSAEVKASDPYVCCWNSQAWHGHPRVIWKKVRASRFPTVQRMVYAEVSDDIRCLERLVQFGQICHEQWPLKGRWTWN